MALQNSVDLYPKLWREELGGSGLYDIYRIGGAYTDSPNAHVFNSMPTLADGVPDIGILQSVARLQRGRTPFAVLGHGATLLTLSEYDDPLWQLTHPADEPPSIAAIHVVEPDTRPVELTAATQHDIRSWRLGEVPAPYTDPPEQALNLTRLPDGTWIAQK